MTIISSPRRKRLSLHVTPDAKVIVKAPIFVSKKICLDFVTAHYEWVQNKLARIPTPLCYKQGELLWYRGGRYPLVYRQQKEGILYEKGTFFCSLTANPSMALEGWYRKEMKTYLEFLVPQWGKMMNVTYGSVRVNDAKTRLGSCSGLNNLNFNFRLILAPPEMLEYVIIHELAHCRHKHHQREFWAFVEEFCPHYKERRQWLKNSFSTLIF